MRKFEISQRLEKVLKKLIKKDKKKYEIILNKIGEIIESENITHYKNLRYDLGDSKRVHINTHFVLVFRYDPAEDKIFFDDFGHHDKIYSR